MKITDKNDIRNTRKGQQPSTSKNNDKVKSLFSSEINTRLMKTESYDQDIAELRTELDTVGNSLEHEPTLKNFKLFRNLLSKLTNQVSAEAYRLEKIGGTPLNPRYYEIITVIDKEADKLYELIIKEQKNRIAITASVIGIKGLLVDLIM